MVLLMVQKSQGQPRFGCIKPVVNNGISSTNLNWWVCRISEASTVVPLSKTNMAGWKTQHESRCIFPIFENGDFQCHSLVFRGVNVGNTYHLLPCICRFTYIYHQLSTINSTRWKINMEPTNLPFGKDPSTIFFFGSGALWRAFGITTFRRGEVSGFVKKPVVRLDLLAWLRHH